MASSRVLAAVALAVVAASLPAGASGQSTSGCTAAMTGLAPCLGYVAGNATTPSSGCCSQLSVVVKSQPQCLCSILNGGAAQYGVNVNRTQALKLPAACKVSTPPASACNGTSTGSSVRVRASFLLAFVLVLPSAYALEGFVVGF